MKLFIALMWGYSPDFITTEPASFARVDNIMIQLTLKPILYSYIVAKMHHTIIVMKENFVTSQVTKSCAVTLKYSD